jgi:DNA replication protein DnaC
MKKIDSHVIDMENVDDLIQQTIASFYQDPIVSFKMKQLAITDQEIHLHFATLVNYQQSQIQGQACLNAKKCLHEGSHYLVDIERDEQGRIQRLIKPCPMIEKDIEALDSLVYLEYDGQVNQSESFDQLGERKVLSKLFFYLAQVMEEETRQNLFLHGPHQTGKSFALAVFAYRYALHQKGKIAFIKTHEWLQKLVLMRQSDLGRFDKEMTKLKNLDILILDELGASDLDEDARDAILIPLLNERLKAKKITMINSVFSLRELVNVFKKFPSWEPRVRELISLIQANATVIELSANYTF